MPLTVWSSARYTFPLPHGHRFPVEKYALLRERVVTEGVVAPERVLEPEGASDHVLALAHTTEYVARFTQGRLDAVEIRRLGFPWSPALVERSRRAVGGTIAAARHALDHGTAMNLAGGTHHAFPDHGEGFCVFNDVAVAFQLLREEGRVRRAAIIDLDVHQGNGTHAIFADDPDVFTFSMHGARNYPFKPLPSPFGSDARPGRWDYGVRVPGTLDIDLDDETGDDEYLALLEAALPRVLRSSRADVVFYLAGADPHEGDRLGRMRLTSEGLLRRDVMVLQSCREIGLPVVIVIAGGYGRDIETTVNIHIGTARVAGMIG